LADPQGKGDPVKFKSFNVGTDPGVVRGGKTHDWKKTIVWGGNHVAEIKTLGKRDANCDRKSENNRSSRRKTGRSLNQSGRE